MGDAVSDLQAARPSEPAASSSAPDAEGNKNCERLSEWKDRCTVVDDLPAAIRLIAEATISDLTRSKPVKLLVTGGAGFIGSVVTEQLLAEGHDVVVLDSLKYGFAEAVTPPARFVRGDILDEPLLQELFRKERFDAVAHLAAEAFIDDSVRDPGLFYRVNVCGGLNLLDAMLPRGREAADLLLDGGRLRPAGDAFRSRKTPRRLRAIPTAIRSWPSSTPWRGIRRRTACVTSAFAISTPAARPSAAANRGSAKRI